MEPSHRAEILQDAKKKDGDTNKEGERIMKIRAIPLKSSTQKQ